MELLKELAYYIDQHQKREPQLLHNPQKKKSLDKLAREAQYYELFEGLAAGRWKREEEIAAHFGFKKGEKAFSRFKEAAKERFVNTANVMEIAWHEERAAPLVRLEMARGVQTFLQLVHQGAIKAAQLLGKDCLKRAITEEHISSILLLADHLRSITIGTPHTKEVLYYNDLIDTYLEAYQLQLRLSTLVANLFVEYNHKKGVDKSYAATYRAAVRQQDDLVAKHPYKVIRQLYWINRVQAASLGAYWEEGLLVSEEALIYCDNQQFRDARLTQMFANFKISFLIHLKRYAEAKKTAIYYTANAWEGHHTWFKTRELSTINALHGEDYQYAWETVQATLKHPRFKHISPLDQETWRLYEGHLYYLVQCGELALPPQDKDNLRKFRLQAWLNDLPNYSQDKQGGNIPILMLQVLFLSCDRDTDALEKRVEAMRKYIQRNLNKDEDHRRTDLYLRLLEGIPKYQHDYEGTTPAREALERELVAQPTESVVNAHYEIEIFPYERQWYWVSGSLGIRPKA